MFDDALHYIRFLIALVAVLDPFIAVPVFLAACANRGAVERKRAARLIVFTVFGVLAGAALIGESLLRVMGTSLAAFRLGGGLVLLLMALAMLHARTGDVRQSSAEAAKIDEADTASVMPIAIPLLAGPGAISTVMIAAAGGGWMHQATVVVVIALVCALLWLMLSFAEPISDIIGISGLNVANRLLGLLLAAIAFESMATGLRELFPVLAGR